MAKRHIPIIEKLGIGEEASGLTSFVETSAGNIQVKTPSGVQEIAHEGNINAILQAAGGAGWEKVQATTASYVITRPASGAGLDLHIEAGGSLAALASTSWPIPANGVDQLRIRNFSGSAKTLTAGAGWTIVTADGNPVTGDSYSIPDDRAVEVTLDPDGFAQVVPWGGEVSVATFNTGMAGKSDTSHAHTGTYEPSNANIQSHISSVANPHSVTKAQIGLGSVDNTSDTAKPVSTVQQTALDGKSATTHNHSGTYEPSNSNIQSHVASAHAPSNAEQNLQPDWTQATTTADDFIKNKPTTMTPSAHIHAESEVTNLTTNLAAKQATLVSGTNIKTVNSASVLGSGNIAVAADLPGGVATNAFDDGLDSGNSIIDRATVSGQTILKYQTSGSSTFKVPTGVTSIDYLIVAGGGGGGKSIGAGGGAGGMLTATGYVVTPGASLSVTVGVGGAGATTTTARGVNGSNSTLEGITPADGGGGGTGQSVGFPTGPGGAAGGSGGGGARNNTTGGGRTVGQGNVGGSGSDAGSAYGGGGGGGAGAAGGNGSGTAGGSGGVGLSSSITGTPTFYAGGGGAGVNTGTPGLGGNGGGGDAGTGANPGVSGAANTGGGGGGSESTANAGSGGSGIVVIRFATQTRSYQALQPYADNTAALSGGRLVGEFYRRTSDGSVQQVQ